FPATTLFRSPTDAVSLTRVHRGEHCDGAHLRCVRRCDSPPRSAAAGERRLLGARERGVAPAGECLDADALATRGSRGASQRRARPDDHRCAGRGSWYAVVLARRPGRVVPRDDPTGGGGGWVRTLIARS